MWSREQSDVCREAKESVNSGLQMYGHVRIDGRGDERLLARLSGEERNIQSEFWVCSNGR